MLLRTVSAVHGIFYVATGVWPLVNTETFQAVTGPKTDLWLVITVGLLMAVSGVVYLSAAWRGIFRGEVVALAIGQAFTLTGIDVYYVVEGTIAPIYLLDAVAELLLVAGWLVGLRQLHREPR